MEIRSSTEICYSMEVEAFYVTLSDGDVARTVSVSDDVLVDLEADGTVHGLELLCSPTDLTVDDRSVLVERFPAVAQALEAVEHLTRLSA